jgi:hypothetical protein
LAGFVKTGLSSSLPEGQVSTQVSALGPARFASMVLENMSNYDSTDQIIDSFSPPALGTIEPPTNIVLSQARTGFTAFLA